MSILKTLAQALEEQDIALSNAQRDSDKWESLYEEMCKRNAQLIEEKENLQDKVTHLEEEIEKMRDSIPDSFEKDLGD